MALDPALAQRYGLNPNASGGGGAFSGLASGINRGIQKIGGMFSRNTGPEEQHRQMLMEYYNSIGGRGDPQAGAAAQGQYSGFRQNQADLVSRLEAMSQGKGPSLAMAQMRAGMDKAQSQQASLANSGRGGPMMALAAANNMARQGAETTQQGAAARIAEQQMALQQLGMTLHSGRGADESMNKFNASQQNNTSLANLDARLRAMGMNDQARLGILQQFGQNAMNAGNRPSFGESLLAGGAGLLSSYIGAKGGGGGGGGGAMMSGSPQYAPDYGTGGTSGFGNPYGTSPQPLQPNNPIPQYF